VIQETYTQLDEHRKCYRSLITALDHVFDFKKPAYKTLRHYFATSVIPNLLITFYIHRAIKYWIETPSIYELFLPDPLIVLVIGLKAESDRRMADGAREMAQLFDSLLMMNSSRAGLALVPEIGLAYETLPIWAEHLSGIPTKEDGYPTTYTLEEKVKEMSRFLDALHALGWAYADISLSETIAKVEQDVSAARSAMRVALCHTLLG